MSPARALAVSLLAVSVGPGCARGCASGPAEPTGDPVAVHPDVLPGIPPLPARCVREITRAAVTVPPGTGDIDGLSPACGGNTLAVFTVRGHVLSRVTRRLQPGAGFGAPLTLATGADRVGVLGEGAVDGPVVWRSPVAGLDDPERDDLWAAVVVTPDGGISRVLRGDVLMPAGVVGVGVPAPGTWVDGRVELLAAVARTTEAPGTARVSVVLGRDGMELPAGGAPTVIQGELRGWEPVHGVALARMGAADGTVRLGASRPGGTVASVGVPAGQVLVAPRGVDAGDASVFAVAGFTVGGDSGRCVDVGGLCVDPGPVDLLVFHHGTLRRVTVAPAGLPDTLTARGDTVTVLYIDGTAQQAAVQVELTTGTVRALTLTPPEGLPSIDHPVLVRCEDGPWLVAEVSLPGADGGTSPGVTALPWECLAR